MEIIIKSNDNKSNTVIQDGYSCPYADSCPGNWCYYIPNPTCGPLLDNWG